MADEPGPVPERRPRRGRSNDPETTTGTLFRPSAGTAHERAPAETSDRSTSGDRAAWLPVIDGRSPNEWVCPFLRSVDDDERAGVPVEAPDPANRCAALREPVPQSLRQQELVCLTSGHVNCPRYLRGAVAVAELPPRSLRSGRSVSPAIFGSVVVLVLAFSASVAFVMSRGGLELTPAATSSPSASVVAVVVSGEPSLTATVAPSATPAPTDAPAPTTAPTADPSPTPAASPAPTAAQSPAPTSSPTSTSDRYALLTACPDAPDCWIYRVRSGDNLASIANYFGVPLESIYDGNPWTLTTSLRAGQELRLPPPTR